MEPREETSAEIRAHLLKKIDEWRQRLPPDGTFMGTYGAGVALGAVSLAGVLIRRAVAVLLPDAEPSEKKPTMGFYIHTIERYGRELQMTRVGPSRRLITASEIKVLNTLSRKRAALAHQEETWASDASAIGRLQPSEVRELLDVVLATIQLPIFDELIYREGQSIPSNAT